MTLAEWTPSTLPGCHGHPCEMLRAGVSIARVWQASPITARGVWCWSLDGGEVHTVRGNKGIAKTAARRTLLGAATKQGA